MRHLRFFVPLELESGNCYKIPNDKVRHITQVLRLGVGAEFVLFNGDGKEYTARLIEVTKKMARVLISAEKTINRESNLRIHLIQSLSKGDRMDVTIQKCVELGVDLIYPVNTCRSNLKITAERAEKKHNHWFGVVIAACEQAGRNIVPKLKAVSQFEDAINEYALYAGLKLILHPDAITSLFQLGGQQQDVIFLVGPEGGFSNEELLLAKQHGFQQVSLGPRTLRTETAAMAAIAGMQAVWGDI